MNKIVLFVVFIGIAPLFGAERTVKPEELGAYAGIQAFSKQPSGIKPSLINKISADIIRPDKSLRFPMTFDDRLATDGMLIFLDNTEEKLLSVSGELLFALHQKACPILASTHLLKIIEETPNVAQFAATLDTPEAEKIRQYFDALKNAVPRFIDENPNASQEEIIKKINDFLYEQALKLNLKYKAAPIKDATNTTFFHSLMKEFISWNRDEWLVKTVDKTQQLLLLIPRNYTFKNKSVKFIENLGIVLSKDSSLTAFEYKTGLKIDHMQTLNDYHAVINAPSDIAPDKYFMESVLKSDIFVSQAEYNAASSLYEQPRWALYMKGHGTINSTICGLSIPAFSQFLDFLDTKINTALLCYTSCYTIGTHQKLIYKDLENPLKLSFPVATTGVFDDITVSPRYVPWSVVSIELIDFENKKLVVKYYVDFKKFINQSTAHNPRIVDIVSTVMAGTKSLPWLDPHIRLGGSEWFTLDDAQHKIAMIGTPFAQTCTKIDLRKKFTKKGIVPVCYCLYTPIIPCELIINSPDYKPAFFPMAPLKITNQGAFMYYIKKLTVPHLSLNDVYNMFTVLISNDYNLVVFFDEIELKEIDHRIIHTEPQTIRNVLLIYNKPHINSILFTFTDPEYKKQLAPRPEKFYQVNFDNPILKKEEIEDVYHLKQEFGLTDALAQFEQTKRQPAQELEKILQEKIKRGSHIPEKAIPQATTKSEQYDG